jgi:hypothetical protein
MRLSVLILSALLLPAYASAMAPKALECQAELDEITVLNHHKEEREFPTRADADATLKYYCQTALSSMRAQTTVRYVEGSLQCGYKIENRTSSGCRNGHPIEMLRGEFVKCGTNYNYTAVITMDWRTYKDPSFSPQIENTGVKSLDTASNAELQAAQIKFIEELSHIDTRP